MVQVSSLLSKPMGSRMSVKDRLLRRLWFLNHFGILTRELEFHRDHQGELLDDGLILWRLDGDSGFLRIDPHA